MKSSRLLLSVVAMAAYCATTSLLSALTINAVSLSVDNFDAVGLADNQSLFGSASSHTLNGADGGSTGSLAFNHVGSGDQATLSFDIDQTRVGALGAFTAASGRVEFTVGSNTTFALAGSFAVQDVTTAPGGVYLSALFFDLTANQYVFRTEQNSKSTLNESFTLNAAGGDTSTNTLTGVLTGNLTAGHTYRYFVTTDLNAGLVVNGGATGNGNFTLKIGGGDPAASVPDGGSSLGLLAFGLAGLAGVRRQLSRR